MSFIMIGKVIVAVHMIVAIECDYSSNVIRVHHNMISTDNEYVTISFTDKKDKDYACKKAFNELQRISKK